MPHYEWPKPEEDRDTITVDRISADIDGPAHRFVIRRGDTVEVFFARDKLEIGEVVGISLASREVRVSFQGDSKITSPYFCWSSRRSVMTTLSSPKLFLSHFQEGTDGIWFAVGQIYPAIEATDSDRDTAPLSQLAGHTSREPEGGFSEQDRVPDFS